MAWPLDIATEMALIEKLTREVLAVTQSAHVVAQSILADFQAFIALFRVFVILMIVIGGLLFVAIPLLALILFEVGGIKDILAQSVGKQNPTIVKVLVAKDDDRISAIIHPVQDKLFGSQLLSVPEHLSEDTEEDEYKTEVSFSDKAPYVISAVIMISNRFTVVNLYQPSRIPRIFAYCLLSTEVLVSNRLVKSTCS
ncbi:hypothetical protein K432DRAFT_407961 [Lepidopterella palustris CBS 459.81]|uniref:Uncharacterized protein n=1 Tax=Lepidopterella palustris CBS 459.81 TaxID=1314670 RepID=A0A8E2E3N4_9PEZI|nr:hypothetical protein K432DRAFT_407961 [Lepidopterella palustris CBS 459.81]